MASKQDRPVKTKRRQKAKGSVTTRCPKCGYEDHFTSMDEVTSHSIEDKIPATLYCDRCNTVMEIV